MLLPRSEWPLKIGAQRILASSPMQMSHKMSGYWTKVHPICSRGYFFIDGFNAAIRVAIRPPVVE